MDQVGNLLHRPRLYYNVDGLGELGASVMCLGFALLLWLLMRSPADSIWHRISFFAFVGLALLIRYGTKAVKTRITYPRTGFVQYRARDSRWRPAVLGAAGGAATAVGLSIALRRHWNLTTPAALFGLLFAATYAYHFARTIRWKWAVAGIVALGSVAIAVLPEDVIGAVANHSWQGAFVLTMTLYGAVLSISGGISFWLYLRHTEAPAPEAQ